MPLYSKRFDAQRNLKRYRDAAGSASALTLGAPGYSNVNPLLQPGAQRAQRSVAQNDTLLHYQMKQQAHQQGILDAEEARRQAAHELNMRLIPRQQDWKERTDAADVEQRRREFESRYGTPETPWSPVQPGTPAGPQPALGVPPAQAQPPAQTPGLDKTWRTEKDKWERDYMEAGLAMTPEERARRTDTAKGNFLRAQRDKALGAQPQPEQTQPGLTYTKGKPGVVQTELAQRDRQLGLQEQNLELDKTRQNVAIAAQAAGMNVDPKALARGEVSYVGMNPQQKQAMALELSKQNTSESVAAYQNSVTPENPVGDIALLKPRPPSVVAQLDAMSKAVGNLDPDSYKQAVAQGSILAAKVAPKVSDKEMDGMVPFFSQAASMMGYGVGENVKEDAKTGKPFMTAEGQKFLGALKAERKANPNATTGQLVAGAAKRAGLLNYADPNTGKMLDAKLATKPKGKQAATLKAQKRAFDDIQGRIALAVSPYGYAPKARQAVQGKSVEALVAEMMVGEGMSADEVIDQLRQAGVLSAR